MHIYYVYINVLVNKVSNELTSRKVNNNWCIILVVCVIEQDSNTGGVINKVKRS